MVDTYALGRRLRDVGFPEAQAAEIVEVSKQTQNDFVTKDYLDIKLNEQTVEVNGKFNELTGKLNEINGKFNELKGEFKADIATMKAELLWQITAIFSGLFVVACGAIFFIAHNVH